MLAAGVSLEFVEFGSVRLFLVRQRCARMHGIEKVFSIKIWGGGDPCRLSHTKKQERTGGGESQEPMNTQLEFFFCKTTPYNNAKSPFRPFQACGC